MKFTNILIVMLCFSLIVLSSCDFDSLNNIESDAALAESTQNQNEGAATEVDEEIVLEDTVEEIVVEEAIEEEPETTCTVSEDCLWNEHCIQGVCGTTSKIYDTEGDCESKCNFNNVVVITSDGDELTLSRGQGSYTAAGAVEWKLLSSSDYCLGENPTPVAIQLIKKNLGQILSKEVIVLDVGEVSDSILHPTIASIDFTLEVQSIDESCS